MARKKSAAASRKWCACDCETDAFDGLEVRPFLWCVKTSDELTFAFWETEKFVEWLKEWDGIAYAHNGGKFDWLQRGVIEHLNKGGIMLINSRLAKAKIGLCELRDSWLIIPAPLSAGDEKMDFDYEILNRKNKSQRETLKREIEAYCMQDVIALYNLIARFREVHGDALTQAGAALKTWEKMGGSKRRYGKFHDDFFRRFYHGGRVEVFEYGAPHTGEFEYYDINSSYPSAMLQLHPLGVQYIGSTKFTDKTPGASFWTVRGISRGALPFKDKTGLWFPDDNIEREYRVTGWEVRAALDTGTLDIVSAVGHVPMYFESLREYVERFFTARQDAKKAGDVILDLLCKLLLNSLYGKYGANCAEYRDYLIVEPGEKVDGYMLDSEGDGYDLLWRPTERGQYFDVALAASITGYARAALWRAIHASEKVVYCDTDSIMCKKFAGTKGDKLGEWKLEAKLKNLHIAGKKLYAGQDTKSGEWKVAHKGFSKLNTQVEDVIKAAKGEIIEICNLAPSIKISGAQTFITRRMRKTEKGRKTLAKLN